MAGSSDPRDETPSAPASPVRAVVSGIGWNTAGLAVQTLVSMLALLVVARYLSPADFAVAGMAATITSVLAALAGASFIPSIVQRPELDRDACDSIFWLVCGVAALLVTGVWFAAPAVARYYGEPNLPFPLIVATASIACVVVSQVPLGILHRRMQFRELNLARAGASAVAAVVAIVLAVRGYGYWAAVVPGALTESLAALAAFAITRFVPRLHFRFAEIRAHAAFAGAMTTYALVYLIAARADYLVLSRLWTSSQFGLYYFAHERSRQLLNVLTTQVSGTLLPAFSRMQGDLVRVRQAYVASTRAWCAVTYPLHLLMLGLADPAVPFLFGEQWRPAIPILQWFVVFTLAAAPWAMASDVLSAVGRPRDNVYFSIVRLVTTVPVLAWLVHREASPVFAAAALMILWVCIVPFWGVLLRRSIGLGFAEQWRAVRPILVATVVAALVLYATRELARAAQMPSLPLIATVTLAAMATYVAAAWRTLRDLVRSFSAAGGPARS